MYKCESCNITVEFASKEERTKARKLKLALNKPTEALKVITEVRTREYKNKHSIGKRTTTSTTTGTEIVKEIKVCQKCYNSLREE